MGQNLELKSSDGINWKTFPNIKSTGKKNSQSLQTKKTKNTGHPNFLINFPFEPNDFYSTKT